MIIYCTLPTKKVVAEAEIVDVLVMTKEKLWEETKNQAGISKENFMKYFENSEHAYAYKLGKITVYSKEKELIEYGIRYAPQSFIYIWKKRKRFELF